MVWRDTEWNGIHMIGRQRRLFDYDHNSIYASIVVMRCNCENCGNRVTVQVTRSLGRGSFIQLAFIQRSRDRSQNRKQRDEDLFDYISIYLSILL